MMNKSNINNVNPWLCRFAVLTAVVTFLLIGLGGLVTSHGAGMSVPDWPNTYGYNMFAFPISKWVGGIFSPSTRTGCLPLPSACLQRFSQYGYGLRNRAGG